MQIERVERVHYSKLKDMGKHYDVEIKGWMQKGGILMCKLKGQMDKGGWAL